MNTDTRIVKVVYKGKTVSLRLWVGGRGRVRKDYCTSLDQLRRKLCRTFRVGGLDLYCVFERRLYRLTSERHLRRVVNPLQDQGVLFINAFKRGERVPPTFRQTQITLETQGVAETTAEQTQYQADEGDLDVVYPSETLVRDGSVNEVITHFIVHDYDCYHCETSPIRGVRYAYKKNDHYCLCGTCYRKLGRTDRTSWEQRLLPWAYNAPAGPLYYGKEGEDVRQLQYLLTCFGYMRLSDTSVMVGFFGERTGAAIRKFRRENDVHGGDPRTYDLSTAHRLARVVRRYRRLGHSYV